jgi:hypothetical protein
MKHLALTGSKTLFQSGEFEGGVMSFREQVPRKGSVILMLALMVLASIYRLLFG